MRMDLHCHTRRIKSGDGPGREVSPKLFRKKILEADVKIIAITNHNYFDYNQFHTLKNQNSDICQIWPGIEIDVKDCSSRWHLIVVVNPDETDVFNSKVSCLFDGDDLETCTHNLDEIHDAFGELDAIYISHFHKAPAISESDRKKLLEIVGDSTRIFNETSDHRSMGVFANYDYNTLVGSDVSDWSNYEKCSFAELRLPIESFQQFCLLAKRDSSVVDSLINTKRTYAVQASPYKSVKFDLKLYEDVNIIFGAKGTGKTEILNSLYNGLLEQGLRCEKNIASERTDEFNELTKNNGMPEDISILDREPCTEQFRLLSDWTDCSPTQFSKYIDWYRTKENNSNKRRMKVTNAQEIQFNKSSKYESHKADFLSIRDIKTAIENIQLSDYIDDSKIGQLNELISLLKDSIFRKRKGDVAEESAVMLTNYSINKIKAIADKNTDSVSKPSKTGYREFAHARLRLLVAVDKIRKNLEPVEVNTQVPIGALEDKGKIYQNSRYRMLCEESRTVEFSKNITVLKEVKKQLSNVNTHILDVDLAPILSILVSLCESNNISSTACFVGRSRQIVDADQKEYKPSNGEKGILLLQRVLSKEADAYFLDEPELGMGNSYIDKNIRPLISELGRRRKIVVIATHNANIAVRTLPYMSIYRTHKNGIYKTYTGNPFNDKLINIDDSTDILSWTVESLNSLEGSKEAFYDRRDIYES
jgi:PHP domain